MSVSKLVKIINDTTTDRQKRNESIQKLITLAYKLESDCASLRAVAIACKGTLFQALTTVSQNSRLYSSAQDCYSQIVAVLEYTQKGESSETNVERTS